MNREPDALEAARAHYRTAMSLLSDGRYRESLSEWQAAYVASKHPVLLLNQAGAYQELGRPSDALRALACFEARAKGSASAECLASVQSWATELEAARSNESEPEEPLTPTFSCESLDQTPAKRARLAATALPRPTMPARVEPRPSSHARATPPPVADRGSPGRAASALGFQRVIALTLGGVGVAGLAVGTAFGLDSLSNRNDADALCTRGPSGDRCPPEGMELGDQAIASGTKSTVAFAVGAASLAAGAVLWFTAGAEGPNGARVGLGGTAGPRGGGVDVRGAW